ncbi:MAG: acyltransferase domain-containing protein, partial [Planctomycetota bacterium]
MFMCFSKTQALSRSGDARPFAADADGTVLGEGIGMLVLKRLEDAERDGDRVYAVLRGIGASSDGRSQSIYAPRAEGQAAALREAYRIADVSPATVELVEAHGTGTTVGDVVEFEALRSVYREAAPTGRWCTLGSVKSQIGHTKAAAGAASLIKAVLALHHRVLPPTIKSRPVNPKLELTASPFFISEAPRPWISDGVHPRRAAVSSFGFGGSNFHAVLEESAATRREPAWDATVQIIALSADDEPTLRNALRDWRQSAERPLAPDVLAHRAAESRRTFRRERALRLVMVLGPHTELPALLRSADDALDARGVAHDWHIKDVYFGANDSPGDLAFLFPGQGSQYVGMAGDVVRTFPEALDAIEEAHRAALDERDLAGAIYPPPAEDDDSARRQQAALTDTETAQPALGAVSLAMLRVLKRFGIEADFTAGHSYGELVALRAAGRIGDATLRKLSQLRAKLKSKEKEAIELKAALEVRGEQRSRELADKE